LGWMGALAADWQLNWPAASRNEVAKRTAAQSGLFPSGQLGAPLPVAGLVGGAGWGRCNTCGRRASPVSLIRFLEAHFVRAA